MDEFERVQRRRRRFALLVVVACVTGVGAWLTGPIGVIMVGMGNATGWALVAAGIVLLAVTVIAIIAAARGRVVPDSLPGAANPHFDEPQPSSDPRPGISWAGSGIGSR
jgi:hypothetical protein